MFIRLFNFFKVQIRGLSPQMIISQKKGIARLLLRAASMATWATAKWIGDAGDERRIDRI